MDPLWMRVSVAGKVHKPLALIDLLHNVFHFPKNGNQAFILLANFKTNMQKKLKKLVKDYQWDLLCHDCTQQKVPCQTPCPKKGVTNLNDLDTTGLSVIYRNIEHIIPNATQPISQLKAQYKLLIDQACEDRNLLMHFPTKSMSQKQFDDAWDGIEKFLIGVNYSNMTDFYNMKTCLLDEYYKQQIEWLSDVCRDLDLKKCDVSDFTNLQNIVNDIKTKDIIQIKDATKSIEQNIVELKREYG